MANPIKEIFSFIFNDLKEDVIFVKKAMVGKLGKPKYDVKQIEWGHLFVEAIKDNWIWYMIIVCAFVMGYIYAAKRYEQIANNFVIEYCLEYGKYGVSKLNDTILGNFSQFK